MNNRYVSSAYARMLFLCCGITFGCYFASYMRFPIVPLFARSLGMDTAQIGIINSAFFLMAGCLSFPMGMLSDRFGYKRLVAIGTLILSGTSFLLCFSHTLMQITMIYLCFGIGMAAFGPTMMTFAADISPPTHLGRSYGFYTLALFCGMSLGPAVGGTVAQKFGFVPVFMISGLFIFLNFWVIIFLLPGVKVPDSGARSRKISLFSKELLKNRPLLGGWMMTLGGCFCLGMFLTFIPLHAHNKGLNAREIGFIFFTQGLFNALSRIPFGHLSDRLGNRGKLVMAGFVVLSASMAGFGVSEQTAHFIIFAAMLGSGMGLTFTSLGALIAESVPPEARGQAMGGYNTCIYFGMMFSASSMGIVIQRIGFRSGFLIIASAVLFLIGLFYPFMKGIKVRGEVRG